MARTSLCWPAWARRDRTTRGLLARYLDPTRALAAGETLGANPDRVVRSYGGEMTLANWLRLHFGYQGDEQGAQGELARQQAKVDAQAAADASRKRRDLSQDYRQESELHLVNWLRKQHGYEGGQDGAAAAFAALAPAERGIYARQLFFAELKEGGREYNEEGGPRFGSYLRGRRAIAALFPRAMPPVVRSATRAASRCTAARDCAAVSAATSSC